MSITDYYNESYSEALQDWNQLEDCYNEKIKKKETDYLPKTSGMILDKNSGTPRYEAYLRRANYFNHIKETVTNSKNAIGRKPAIISELPDDLKYLLDTFNSENESVFSVLDDVYCEQMKLGRVGYLVDIIQENDRFEVVRYKAQSILYWDFKRVNGTKTLNFVVLSEEVEELTATGTTEINIKYRVLGLDGLNNYYTILLNEDEYSIIGDLKLNLDSVLNSLINLNDERVVFPTYKGKMLNYIPFKVANTDNLKMDISQAPLLNQSNLSIGVYNADANHQALVYMQTANMLLLMGIAATEFKNNFVGVDGILHTESPPTEVDGKYIGVDGAGLTESRENLNELKTEVGSFGVTITQKNTQESEKSLQSRIQLQTDKLRDVSETGASLIQYLLNTIMSWTGKSEEIIVEANTDFRTELEKASEFKDISEIWEAGRMTTMDYWKWQKKNLYTNLEYDEWLIEMNRKVNNDVDTTLNDEQ